MRRSATAAIVVTATGALLAAVPGLVPGGNSGDAWAQAPAPPPPRVDETIGTWRLHCTVDRMTDRGACVMRHRDWVEPPSPGQAGLALEVRNRDGRNWVPVVAARDMPLEGAARGILALTGTAQLRFPPNRLFEMPCGLDGRSLVCAPRAAGAPRAAAELPGAPVVLVRMVGLGTGGGAQSEPVELPLAATAEALARFQRIAPDPPPPAPPPSAEVRELIDRLQRLFGN
jgi:hypothetical protein